MSLIQGFENLLMSLSDLLKDLGVKGDTGENDWSPARLANLIESQSDYLGLVPLAHQLLRRNGDRFDENSVKTWPQLFAKEKIAPFFDFVDSEEESSNEDTKQQPTIQNCLEYLHILATTAQQKRLLSETRQLPPISSSQGFPISLLDAGASTAQKSMLEEGYSYLKEDYDERRKGLIQRFHVLLETTFGNVADTKALIKTESPTSSLEPPEDMSLLVQHFLEPHPLSDQTDDWNTVLSTSRGIAAKTMEDPIDRGGRTGDNSRVMIPEWQDEPPNSKDQKNKGAKKPGLLTDNKEKSKIDGNRHRGDYTPPPSTDNQADGSKSPPQEEGQQTPKQKLPRRGGRGGKGTGRGSKSGREK